ncbi:MAG: maleylpyruvate isomerase family mycothiol-dependent enzyme [Pseudonocardiaceae bacterium]|nr:MAG: maleylpyruvate isomerase family mycothiol-dependent enzyme [Pseudonocardiaceae bacterium]
MSPASPAALPRDVVDAAVSAERRRLADHVAALTDAQLATRSLCTEWTVRDVLAHLTTTTRLSVPLLVRAAVGARGSFDRMEVDLAARRASAFTTGQLVAQLRESAESSRRFPGSSPMDPLMDLVIHGQDISRPLRLPYASPPEVVTASLDHVAGNKLMGGPKRLAGVRLVSTDSEWAHGEGPEVRGADVDLLLVASGRRSGLAGLDGPGVEVVAARL